MPETLTLAVIAVSALAPIACAIWIPALLRDCLRQALALAALAILLALVPDAVSRFVLGIAASAFLLLCLRERRLTAGASAVAWLVIAIVIARYPPSWVLAMGFLLGWAHFAGTVKAAAGRGEARDVTDLAPLVVVVLLGAALVEAEPTLVSLVVFSTISFIVNDVLASDLGPHLPGRARLLPRLPPVPHGMPGAMSDGGTLLGAVGSVCAGLSAGAVTDDPAAGISVALAGIVAGTIDSVLSRTGPLQALSRGNELVNSAGCVVAVAVGVFLFASPSG